MRRLRRWLHAAHGALGLSVCSNILSGVDAQHLAGDGARGVRQQEQHRIADVLRIGELVSAASATARARISSGKARAISVMTMPGATALTVMPFLPIPAPRSWSGR